MDGVMMISHELRGRNGEMGVNTNLILLGILLLGGSVDGLGILTEEARGMLIDLRNWMILGLLLTVADLYAGVMESRRRGAEIRGSRALRRTLDKIFMYVLYLLVAGWLNQCYVEWLGDNEHLITGVTMALIIFIEMKSIWGHICYLNHINFPVWKWVKILIAKIVGRKIDAEVGEAVRESFDEVENIENQDNGTGIGKDKQE